MISIKDIAKKLNVTPSTVSRALNGKKGVSKELSDKILKTCQEMGYRKNAIAQSLITNETKLIGMIIPDITSRYYSFIVKGINTYLDEQGYSVILCNANRSAKTEQNYIELLLSRRVDGIIIISLTATEETLLSIAATGTPVVQIDNAISDKLSSVTNDNYRGSSALFEHMVQLGCRRIGLMLGRVENKTTIDRLRGFTDVMARHKIKVDERLIINIDSTDLDAYKNTPRLLEYNPDSIFAINDNVALGVLRYCMDHNIRVPEELRLAGYDDLDIANMIHVPLTTVHQLKSTLGKAAAHLILQEIKNPKDPHQHITMIPHLVVRQSCGEHLEQRPAPFNGK
ncbi:Purine nucleotide synthesis repressor [Anaerobiospirillum thomasii]|uniref:LacI family DNA-binding transcriptional regulator n=1 Tax=Anaerobiospirillum thomasii TaxID=179995 RepID=UPI000D8F6733|nr:LacI family DNA-binding transcriptional regulator [Anaerobiospirillum thomasii]SPT68300.1 Purine nucleotide synthesis repressor [Anaerobiospirillum thomasii]